MKHNFEERKQNRIDHAQRMAAKSESESDAAYNKATQIGSMIPMGQPILVGHHSERKHRAALRKIDNAMRQSVENSNKSKYYTEKAESIESNTAIFSDDPNALDKLRDKLQALTKLQQLMKDTNNILRKKKTFEDRAEALKEMGFSDERVVVLLTPVLGNGVGFPSYKLTNNNANIKRLQKRVSQLEAISALQTTEETINDTRILFNVEANRVQIIFPSIPAEETREKLKRSGFRWCRSEGAWQRHLNTYALQLAREIVKASMQEVI
jgi:hypothetical protein